MDVPQLVLLADSDDDIRSLEPVQKLCRAAGCMYAAEIRHALPQHSWASYKATLRSSRPPTVVGCAVRVRTHREGWVELIVALLFLASGLRPSCLVFRCHSLPSFSVRVCCDVVVQSPPLLHATWLTRIRLFFSLSGLTNPEQAQKVSKHNAFESSIHSRQSLAHFRASSAGRRIFTTAELLCMLPCRCVLFPSWRRSFV